MSFGVWMWAWLVPCAIAYIILTRIRRWIRIDRIHTRHVLITGCDTGLGGLLAQRLDLLGCRVYAACLKDTSRARLQQVTSQRLKAFVMDVTNNEHVRLAVEFVEADLPEGEGLWGLVNNAGIVGHVAGPPEWHTAADFEQVIEVNAIGAVRVTLAFLPLLKRAQGRVVNASCVFGRLACPFTMPYCMSKAALEMFTDSLRQHVALWGVTVHALEPGLFQTEQLGSPRVRKLLQQGWKDAPLKIKSEFGEEYANELTMAVQSWYQKTSSPDLSKVMKAYVHALTARCPRVRYSVGWDAKLLYLPLSYLPSCMQDAIVGRLLGRAMPASLT